MKTLLLLVSIGLAQCRPQYNYNRPETPSGSYGAPSGGSGRLSFSTGLNTHGSNNIGISGGVGQLAGGGVGGNLGLSQSGSFGISGHGSINGIGGSSGGFGGLGGGGGGSSGGIGSGLIGGGSGISDIGGGSTGLGILGSGAVGGGQTLVQKHIYVHVAPPEPEEHRASQVITGGPVQKHYRIIFIKAPTPSISPASVIASQQRSEEKTLIYVLVKKPESAEDIVVPTAAPTPPSKPEVYFIRYKATKQATGGSAGGISINTGGSSASGVSGGSISGTSGVSGSYGPPGQSGPY